MRGLFECHFSPAAVNLNFPTLPPPAEYEDNMDVASEFCSPVLDIGPSSFFKPSISQTTSSLDESISTPSQCPEYNGLRARWARWSPRLRLCHAWILVNLGAHHDAPARFRAKIVKVAGKLLFYFK